MYTYNSNYWKKIKRVCSGPYEKHYSGVDGPDTLWQFVI